MAKKENRVVVTMACTDCKERNYTTTKNRKNDSQRIEFKKYCRRCRKHTLHREAK
jgi:large subunit ribosomal protein L33